jgi:hypothetical protein
MIKNVLSNIGGVGLYGVISICLFFALFAGMVVWATRLKKPFLKSMSGLPLNDGETKTKETSHE